MYLIGFAYYFGDRYEKQKVVFLSDGTHDKHNIIAASWRLHIHWFKFEVLGRLQISTNPHDYQKYTAVDPGTQQP